MDYGVFVVGGSASAFLSGADGCVDFAGDVAVGGASPAVLAGDVAVEVASVRQPSPESGPVTVHLALCSHRN